MNIEYEDEVRRVEHLKGPLFPDLGRSSAEAFAGLAAVCGLTVASGLGVVSHLTGAIRANECFERYLPSTQLQGHTFCRTLRDPDRHDLGTKPQNCNIEGESSVRSLGLSSSLGLFNGRLPETRTSERVYYSTGALERPFKHV